MVVSLSLSLLTLISPIGNVRLVRLHCLYRVVHTKGEGGLWPSSPLVQMAGANLISSEEVVFSEFIKLSVISMSRVN